MLLLRQDVGIWYLSWNKDKEYFLAVSLFYTIKVFK